MAERRIGRYSEGVADVGKSPTLDARERQYLPLDRRQLGEHGVKDGELLTGDCHPFGGRCIVRHGEKRGFRIVRKGKDTLAAIVIDRQIARSSEQIRGGIVHCRCWRSGYEPRECILCQVGSLLDRSAASMQIARDVLRVGFE